jgi:hypothetical protein
MGMIFYDSTFVYELESGGKGYILRIIGLRTKVESRAVLGKEFSGNEIRFDDMGCLYVFQDGKEVYRTYNILSL